MSKNSLRPAPKTKIRLKRIILFSAGTIAIAAVVWKVFFVTTATMISNGAFSMFTPGSGNQILPMTWEATLVVDHTLVADTGDIIDFPLLVNLSHPNLKSVSNGGLVESALGYDILFAGANHEQLDHEIESYDPVTGHLVAWVRLPILYKNVDTELTISCGLSGANTNPSTVGVWSSIYEAVWHMKDDPSISNLLDALGNFDAEPHGNMSAANLVDGKIGNAIQFDGTNDYFSILDKHYQTPSSINALTVSAWVQTDFYSNSWNSNWSLLDFDRSEQYSFAIHGQGKVSFCTKSSNSGVQDMHSGTSGLVNDGNWHYVVATFDGTMKRIYLDGVLLQEVTHPGSAIGTGTTRYGFIGDGSKASYYNGPRDNKYYEGKIDELRLHTIALSPGRIATEFNNQSSPETFVQLNNNTSLSIELGSFEGTLSGDEVVLSWTVLSQTNNDYFTIERSVDGKNFETLGTVEGAGTNSEKKKYHLTDDSPSPGINYYKLRQTDYDGKSETFAPISVNYASEVSSITIEKTYPNPFENSFNVVYNSLKDITLEFDLINSSGNSLSKEEQHAFAGKNTYKFSTGDQLPSGVYYLKVTESGILRSTIKLIKK